MVFQTRLGPTSVKTMDELANHSPSGVRRHTSPPLPQSSTGLPRVDREHAARNTQRGGNRSASRHDMAPSFKESPHYTRLKSGRWYCNLCTLPEDAEKEAFTSNTTAKKHDKSESHQEKLKSWTAHAFDGGWGIPPDLGTADWGLTPGGDPGQDFMWQIGGDESIASDDPLRDEKWKWREEHGWTNSTDYKVKKWLRRIREVGGAWTRREDVERPMPDDEEERERERLSPFKEAQQEHSRDPQEVLAGGIHVDEQFNFFDGKGILVPSTDDENVKAPQDVKPPQDIKAPQMNGDAASSGRTVTAGLQAWIDDLATKEGYSHLKTTNIAISFLKRLNVTPQSYQLMTRSTPSNHFRKN
ncbi:hypothetical protein FRC03_000949 [Tulasnella sp. 419]|nr:hypothetical protein FRC03_000949 [Tulasnella sp. 419]